MADQLNVFVSYARHDGRKYAKRLYNTLLSNGIQAWYDDRLMDDYAARHDISPRIELEIRRADCLILCLTGEVAANLDGLLKRELIYAENHNKPFIVLTFPGHQDFRHAQVIEQIPFALNGRLKFDEGMPKLLERLNQVPEIIEAATIDDPFHHYIVGLYDQIVNYLDTTVFSLLTQIYELDTTPQTKGNPVAVLPMRYSDKSSLVGLSSPEETPGFDSLSDACAYFSHRCFLIGDTGSGKTTALMVYARESLIRYIENPGQPLPVVAALSDWDGSPSIVQWLAQVSNLDADRLFAKVKEDQVLLLLDGLDDLSVSLITDSAGQLKNARLEFMRLLNQFASLPALITCRTDGYYDLMRSG
jgi:hypothetical protein